jgi:hypothetical protein
MSLLNVLFIDTPIPYFVLFYYATYGWLRHDLTHPLHAFNERNGTKDKWEVAAYLNLISTPKNELAPPDKSNFLEADWICVLGSIIVSLIWIPFQFPWYFVLLCQCFSASLLLIFIAARSGIPDLDLSSSINHRRARSRVLHLGKSSKLVLFRRNLDAQARSRHLREIATLLCACPKLLWSAIKSMRSKFARTHNP